MSLIDNQRVTNDVHFLARVSHQDCSRTARLETLCINKSRNAVFYKRYVNMYKFYFPCSQVVQFMIYLLSSNLCFYMKVEEINFFPSEEVINLLYLRLLSCTNSEKYFVPPPSKSWPFHALSSGLKVIDFRPLGGGACAFNERAKNLTFWPGIDRAVIVVRLAYTWYLMSQLFPNLREFKFELSSRMNKNKDI